MTVGFELAQIPDEPRGLAIPTLLLYPADAPEAAERELALGPFALRAAPGAPLRPGPHRVAIVSHGSGGSHLTHRELARALAARGFIAAVPEHPHHNRADDSWGDRLELLSQRPRDLRLVADWLFRERAPRADPAYAVIGHSLGAYTGLALAGGAPTALPHQRADRRAAPIAVEADPRVAALVLLAPATPWFRSPGSLARVTAPILMIASYHDELAPYFYMCQHVIDHVPPTTRVEHELVERAHHYAFLSPWPEALRGPAIPPSLDPPGFDRRAFLDALYPRIGAFLESAL